MAEFEVEAAIPLPDIHVEAAGRPVTTAGVSWNPSNNVARCFSEASAGGLRETNASIASRT
jgi:hypothetical protein